MTPELASAEQAANIAGQILLDCLGRVRAREKGPKDLVTEADLASQVAIQKHLAAAHPDIAFLGEEDPDPEVLSSNSACWVVDPLDGTTNFVHGMPSFAVSIALVREGHVEAGVIWDPVAKECFRAARGRGAELNEQSISTADCVELNQALVAASFSTQVESAEVQRFLAVLPRCQALRRLGSAALNMCYLACGRLDAYWATSVKPWDMAAGALLIEEAGGVITHFDGGPWQVRRPQFTAAATTELHAELRTTLSDSSP